MLRVRRRWDAVHGPHQVCLGHLDRRRRVHALADARPARQLVVAASLDVVYPAVLVACAVLLVAGGITMAAIRAHRVLKWVVSAFYVVTAIEVIRSEERRVGKECRS